MSTQRVATDFDKIIEADRQRRKNEELAKSIFSKKNKKDGNKKEDAQRTPRAPSLASRIGVVKRSSSTSSNPSIRNAPTRPASNIAQNARANRIAAEINNQQSANVQTKSAGSGLSIKGSAAPFVVEARNFAPGTNDADIEQAIRADCIDASGINTLASCRIISTKPTIVAEMVFTERSVANAIIEKYHKQKADGRILELRLARSGPGSMSKQNPKREETPPPPVPVEPELPMEDEVIMEDVETAPEVAPSLDAYDDERQAAERDRKDRESRRIDRDDYDSSSGRRRGDDDGRREERYRERGSDRDRERDRDRTRDRDFERREERPYTRPDDPRGGRSSHYGNGVGRPGYGSGYGTSQGAYRGGRTYSDDTRGGFGGRGGYRAGWRGGYR